MVICLNSSIYHIFKRGSLPSRLSASVMGLSAGLVRLITLCINHASPRLTASDSCSNALVDNSLLNCQRLFLLPMGLSLFVGLNILFFVKTSFI
jgi:hypothetical protein